MPSSPVCSVVIRACNEEKHIGRLLSGILQQTVRPVEIILVDSGSSDATLAIASRYPARVVAIRPEDFSFGRSLNLGCEQAQGELVAIASAHVYPVYPDWLEQLLKPFDDPTVALVFGQQRGAKTSRFSEQQIFATWYPETAVGRPTSPFCNNANAAIRRALWQQRRYDDNLPALEDLEWAAWAMSAGHRLVYAPEATVIHVHEETPRMVYNRYRREAMALKTLHPKERFHLLDALRLYLANIASDGFHALRQKALGREAWGILWFRWMQFWGTYRGFAHAGPLDSRLKQIFYYPRGLRPAGGAGARPVRPIDYGAPGAEETP